MNDMIDLHVHATDMQIVLWFAAAGAIGSRCCNDVIVDAIDRVNGLYDAETKKLDETWEQQRSNWLHYLLGDKIKSEAHNDEQKGD